MTQRMKAWIYEKVKEDAEGVYVYRREVAVPQPQPGEVLLKVLGVSVCGTDEHLFLGHHPEVFSGIIPGHEFYGEVVEVGKNVKGIAISDKVAGESHYVVPGCEGDGVIGFIGPRGPNRERIKPISGAYAEYISIPAACANVLPDGPIMTEFWPSLLEGVGNDYYIVHWLKSERLLDGNIAVFGCGPHGLYTQVFLRGAASDRTRLVAFEVNEFRRGFSRGFGVVDATLNSLDPDVEAKVKDLTGGKMFDVVIDSAGVRREVLDACFRYTRDGGTVILFALYDDPAIKIDGHKPNDIIFDKSELRHKVGGKTLRLKGITGREGIWPDLIRRVHESKYVREKVMRMVTVKGPLDRLRDDTIHMDREVLKRAYRPFGV